MLKDKIFNKSKLLFGCLIAIAVVFPANSVAQVPGQLPVQVFLTDNNGEPIDKQVEVKAALFSARSGGQSIYSETLTTTVNSGFFSMYMGKEKDLQTVFQNNSRLFLQLTIDGETLTPRQQIGSVPYAMRSGNASSLQGKKAEDFKKADATPSTKEPLTVNDQNQVAITSECSEGKILKYDGEKWACQIDKQGVSNLSATSPLTINQSNTVQISSCSSGQILKYNESEQTWECAEDEDTTYTASSGLTRTSTNFSIAEDGVTPSKIEDCSNTDEILKYDGSNWTCGNDNNTTYSSGEGLSLSSTTFSVALNGNSDSGLSVASSGLKVKDCSGSGQSLHWDGSKWTCQAQNYSAGNGLSVSSQTISVATNTDDPSSGQSGLGLSQNGLYVKQGKGLTASSSSGLDIQLDESTEGNSGLSVSSSGLTLKDCSSSPRRLEWDGSKWSCVASSNASAGNGLQSSGNTLSIAENTSDPSSGSSGIGLSGSGLYVAQGDGITANGDGLRVNPGSGNGLGFTSEDGSGALRLEGASRNCNGGESLKYDGSNWKCSLNNYGAGAGITINSEEHTVELDGGADSGLSKSLSGLKIKNCGGSPKQLQWDGSKWTCVDSGGYSAGDGLKEVSQTFSVELDGAGDSGLSTSGSGVTLKSCGSDEILKYTSGTWSCAADNSGGGSASAGDGLTEDGSELDVDTLSDGGIALTDSDGSGKVQLEGRNGICSNGDKLVYDGAGWVCSNQAGRGLQTASSGGARELEVNLGEGLHFDSGQVSTENVPETDIDHTSEGCDSGQFKPIVADACPLGSNNSHSALPLCHEVPVGSFCKVPSSSSPCGLSETSHNCDDERVMIKTSKR